MQVIANKDIMLAMLIILIMAILLVTLFVGRVSEIIIMKMQQRQLDHDKANTSSR